MALQINLSSRIPFVHFERNRDGSAFYSLLKNDPEWGLGDYLQCVMSNPVLFRCIDVIADIVSQAEFKVEDDNENDPLLRLLNNPNEYQSKQDFLKEFIFYKLAYGYVYQMPLGAVGMTNNVERVDSLYNLNTCKIEIHKEFATRLQMRADTRATKQKQFKYCEDHIKTMFAYSEVIPFFDTPNGLGHDFMYSAPSRLTSIHKPIKNIDKALHAENVAIGQAGTWIVSGSSKGADSGMLRGLKGKEKENIERRLSFDTGLGNKRGNIVATETPVSAQSLHTAMNQLGVSESVMNNANLIMNTFGIPKEVYSLDKSGSTYENQKQAYINLIQNIIQPEVDDLCNSYQSFFNYDKKITATFDHLAVMQHIEELKADKALKISQVYRNVSDPMIAESILGIAGINLNEDEV